MSRDEILLAGFRARLARVDVGVDTIALWRVADLEQHVDRVALLAGDDPPEPPYWAHLWSGARVLAEVVPCDRATAIELGCGLGLPGLVAARRGARVTFVDRVAAPLAFVRASAAASGLRAVDVVAADATGGAVTARFDLVLAAELLYDRALFGRIAEAIEARLAPTGVAFLADAGRIDTRQFYAELARVGLRFDATEHRVREEGLPVTVRLVEITHG
jgi:predicted nicotinamide N-methyase